MAVTLVEQPENYTPAYSPLIYTLTSTDSNETNFRYNCRLYNGSDFLGELKAVAHPVDGWGKFDISNIVASQLSEYVDFDSDIFSATQSIDSIEAQFGQEYVSGSTFVRTTGSVSDTKTYFNGSPEYEEFVNIRTDAGNNEHPYLITSGTAYNKYPLTSRRTIETAEGTKQWLYYMASAWENVENIEVRNDDSGATDAITLPLGLQTDADTECVAFRVDKETVEANTSLSDLTNWSVRTRDTTDAATSEWISFELMECTMWDLYSLYYLNRFGGIDSFSFNGKSQKSVRTTRKSYKSIQQRINSDGTVNYNITNHNNKDYHVNYNNRYQLSSGWVSEQHQQSAIDLQTSPVVWMELPNNVIIPVRVDSSSLRIKNRNDGVISVGMTVEHNELTNRQRT